MRLHWINARLSLAVCCVLLAASPVWAQGLRRVRNMANIADKNPYTSDEDVAHGWQLFMGRCASCHGQNGEGGRGAVLNTGQYHYGASDRELFRTIGNGIPNTEMPGTLMTDAEIWRVIAFVKRLATDRTPEDAPRGDPSVGRTVYQSKGCTACHIVNGQGSDFGPDLSAVGARRSLRYLRESVVDPSADVPFAYRAVTVTTKAGTRIRGIHLNEDDYSIQLRDGNGDPRSFLKGDLQNINYEIESLMPSYRSLSAGDLDNLVAYLNSLRGKSE